MLVVSVFMSGLCWGLPFARKLKCVSLPTRFGHFLLQCVRLDLKCSGNTKVFSAKRWCIAEIAVCYFATVYWASRAALHLQNDVFREMFEQKVSNCWRFPSSGFFPICSGTFGNCRSLIFRRDVPMLRMPEIINVTDWSTSRVGSVCSAAARTLPAPIKSPPSGRFFYHHYSNISSVVISAMVTCDTHARSPRATADGT